MMRLSSPAHRLISSSERGYARLFARRDQAQARRDPPAEVSEGDSSSSRTENYTPTRQQSKDEEDPGASAAPPPAPTPEGVFREHAPRVYAVARRMLNNDADAEDVTQEVLLQVVRKLDTFRGDASLATWLHRITVNAALALRRKRGAARERQLGEAPGRPWRPAPRPAAPAAPPRRPPTRPPWGASCAA